MLDPNLPEITPARNPNPPSPVLDFAKWPPDDDLPGAPAGGGGVPAGGGYDSGDGNFKKGRTAPIAILIGVLAVGGFGAFFLLLDDPEVYGLPPDPVVSTRNLGEIWGAAAAAAAVVGVAVLGAIAYGAR